MAINERTLYKIHDVIKYNFNLLLVVLGARSMLRTRHFFIAVKIISAKLPPLFS